MYILPQKQISPVNIFCGAIISLSFVIKPIFHEYAVKNTQFSD